MRIARSLLAALMGLALQGPGAAQDNARLQRGKVLMEGIVACGNCHLARGPQGQPLPERGLSGGMPFEDAAFKSFAANLTPDAATGIGKWTDAQLVKAIREGVRPDGSVIGPPMPIEFYRKLADEDVAAIVAYLRAQPAVANAVPKSEFRVPLPPNYGPPVSGIAVPKKSDKLRYGEYLANIAHCMDCHTPRDEKGQLRRDQWGAGGQVIPGPWGESVTRNLTPHATGLKNWTDAEIARAIRTGVSRNGRPLKPPMAFDWYRNIDDADMAALIGYLRSLKPLPYAGKS